MEFASGAVVRLPAPPPTMTAHPLRLTSATRPMVGEGDSVRRGQLLAEPISDDRACLFSPINGRVGAITSFEQVLPGNHRVRRYSVHLTPSEETAATSLSTEPPRGRTLEGWFDTLRRFGPWRESDRRLDLIPQLNAARKRSAEMLICIGVDTFAPYPDRSSLLASFPDDAVLGTQILADITGVRRAVMVAADQGSVLGSLRTACRNFRVPLRAVSNVYPAADPTLIARIHAGRWLPPDALPTDSGLIMIGPWTAIRIARWFTHRVLDMVRPMMLGWPDPRTPMTPCYAHVGQPLATLHGLLAGPASALAGRVVQGNPMTGRPITVPPLDGQGLTEPPEPVVPDGDTLLSILAVSADQRSEPCLTCGWCAQVCPTELRPIHLVQTIEQIDRSEPQHRSTRQQQYRDRHLRWCIECGLCSHVCPVHLPLAQTLRAAKGDAVGSA